MHRIRLTALVISAVLLADGGAFGRSDADGYSIMVPEKGTKVEKPEPWLAPKYKSPRGTRKHVVIPRSHEVSPLRAAVPPPIVAPGGQVLPNLPTVAPSGPRGSETFQDRAVRCAHQAGVYGSTAGNTTAYVGSCVNQ